MQTVETIANHGCGPSELLRQRSPRATRRTERNWPQLSLVPRNWPSAAAGCAACCRASIRAPPQEAGASTPAVGGCRGPRQPRSRQWLAPKPVASGGPCACYAGAVSAARMSRLQQAKLARCRAECSQITGLKAATFDPVLFKVLTVRLHASECHRMHQERDASVCLDGTMSAALPSELR